MSGLKNFSPVENENTVPAVDQTFKVIMAALRCHADEAGFFDPGFVPARVNAGSFTVEGDKTDVFLVGQRIRLSDDGDYKYGVITGAEFLALTTVTVSLDDGLLITNKLSAVAIGVDPRAVAVPEVALATETTAGIVTLASDEDITNGTEDKVVDAAQLKAGLDAAAQARAALPVSPLSREFTSSAISYSHGSSVAVDHGFGVMPRLIAYEAECLTAEGGYSVGDRVNLLASNSGTNSALQWGLTSKYNTAQITIRFASSGLTIAHGTTGGRLTLTPANWAIFVRAWA
ncbi:hypothetical protein [Kiloniella sp. b19]|uniref:hypothetical protein n=1 Tax=Kiloniella sp. GXU_MW_B19 TaxID=3141326 RepID=UPI0031DF6049